MSAFKQQLIRHVMLGYQICEGEAELLVNDLIHEVQWARDTGAPLVWCQDIVDDRLNTTVFDIKDVLACST